MVAPRDPTPPDERTVEVVPQLSLRSATVLDVVVHGEPVARISVEPHPNRGAG